MIKVVPENSLEKARAVCACGGELKRKGNFWECKKCEMHFKRDTLFRPVKKTRDMNSFREKVK